MIIVGIDPGKTGGIVVSKKMGEIHHAYTLDKLQPKTIFELLKSMREVHKDVMCVKEEFHSYGIDGKTSFKVGEQHGVIDLAFSCFNIPFITVNANMWPKSVCDKEPKDLKTKPRNILAAKRIYPDFDFCFGKKKEHLGVVDASLISHFAWLLHSKG